MTHQSRHHHHRLSACHRHPTTKPITGFCAQCLRERLAGMDPSSTTPTAAELRRTKSYSSSSIPTVADNNNGLSEPRRKSCDVVRPRNRNSTTTLFELFNEDDDRKRKAQNTKPKPKPQISQSELELKEEEEEENPEEVRVHGDVNNNGIDFEEEGEFKTMKEFIDLEWERKKNNNTNRLSLWETASLFSKKLRKWQRKQERNKDKSKQEITDADTLAEISNEKPNVGRLRETQSEVAEYGLFGRRSCDTDPRLSVDAGRYSFDDEPRASCDGYLNEKFSYLPRFTPLVSVIEDVKNLEAKEGEEERSPGGSAQTRDYYGEALIPHRRRRSFDSRRVGLGDVDEVKSAGLNAAKVSPETVGLFHGAKLLVTEKELRDSNWYSVKDESATTKDNVDLVAAATAVGVSQKGLFSFKRSQRKWSNVWNIWGLIARWRSENKSGDEEEEEERCVGESVVGGGARPESWQNLRRVADGDAVEGVSVSQKLIRSYSVSARNSFKMDALILGKNNGEAIIDDMKRKEELVLQRNKSARYSPNNLDNGLLRFYLTPSRAHKRSKSGTSRIKNVHSVAGNVL